MRHRIDNFVRAANERHLTTHLHNKVIQSRQYEYYQRLCVCSLPLITYKFKNNKVS